MRPSLVLLLSTLLLSTGGCLRNRIDLCAMVPPHPECAFLDAGRADAPTDAAPTDAGPTDAPADAPATDAPVETPDAPPDAP